MPKFDLNNYETVEDRLKVFWKDYPEGRIETEILHITPDGTCVTIQANLFKQGEDARPVATGIAQETKGQGGFANADAWMENCETSAIGRALANWKYQGSSKPRPSREEMSKVQVEKKPVKKPTKQEQAAMEKVADEMVSETTEGKNAKQLNQVISGFGFSKDVADTYKEQAFKESKLSNDVESWTNDEMGKFLDLFEKATQKKVDPIEEVFGDVEEKPIMKNPGASPTEKQLEKFNQAVAKSIDKGDDALAAKAKQALASGEITKGNVFDWINSDGDWSLKDGS
mgnify:CR=1 FL=1